MLHAFLLFILRRLQLRHLEVAQDNFMHARSLPCTSKFLVNEKLISRTVKEVQILKVLGETIPALLSGCCQLCPKLEREKISIL